MSRDYKNVNNKDKGPSPVIGNLLSFFTGLSFGLFIAFLFYIQYANKYPQTTNDDNAVLEEPLGQETAQQAEQDNKQQADEIEDVPAPTFDFYKILPNKEINISEWVAEEKQEPARNETVESGIYVLQVGSFKEFDAADQTKATLALLGINAEIQRVVINGQDIRYRVRVGPYDNPDILMEVRKRLEDNNLNFMVLKLKAEDARR